METTDYRPTALFRPLHVGHYGQLGSGSNHAELSRDLQFYREEQHKSASLHTGLLALFDDDEFFGDEFEAALWRELSFLEDGSAFNIVDAVKDPVYDGFRFHYIGTDFFVSRQCPVYSCHSVTISRPAIVFKLLSQLATPSDVSVIEYNLPIH